MIEVNEEFRDRRSPIDRLVELVDHEFEEMECNWNDFLNHWQVSFTLDVTSKAKDSELWLPSEKQQSSIRAIVTKLEFHIDDIREYHM